MHRLGRRNFLKCLAAASGCVLGGAAAPGKAATVMLIVPGDEASASAVCAGAAMASREAERAAALLKRSFRYMEVKAKSPDEAREAAAEQREKGNVFVFGGLTAPFSRALAEANPSVLLLNKRGEDMGNLPPTALSVSPNWAGYATALVSGLQQMELLRFAGTPEPRLRDFAVHAGLRETSLAEAQVVFGPAGSAPNGLPTAAIQHAPATGRIVPVAWHSSLKRYGAAQLNDRFKKETGQEMEEEAWFGWIGVKLLAEAIFRDQAVADIRLDGHKGALLRFTEGVLQQPLYVLDCTSTPEKVLYV